jgi:rare lipoprotein A
VRLAVLGLVSIALAGCGSTPRVEAPPSQRGGFYKDDGPGDKPPANLDAIADAVPRSEPLHRFANRPYKALGKQFTPMTSLQPFRERGMASWYGRRYHGQKTSTGEIYDMYAMSAAHPTLPLPSYARVTSMANGKSVVVRLNDRGPFLGGRVIDLSYTAAHRLGIVRAGSGEVEVEAVLP